MWHPAINKIRTSNIIRLQGIDLAGEGLHDGFDVRTDMGHTKYMAKFMQGGSLKFGGVIEA